VLLRLGDHRVARIGIRPKVEEVLVIH